MVFPVLNMYKVWQLDPSKPVVKALAQPWYMDLPARYLRTTTYLGLALFTYCFCFPLAQAATLQPGWMALVVARNVAIGHILYGGWHHFLYKSRFKDKMKSHKFNPRYPREAQWAHDRFWSTVGFCIESAIEIGMYHLWATGKAEYYTDFWAYPMWSVGWMLFIPYWHDFHFWFIHRMIHFEPLYKWVHSLHHKSFNPGPWSGFSMHPVESTIYLSSCLFPALFLPQHPIHFLFKKFYTSISPIGGHDGFDQPGGGSFIHYLHHAHFNCNYGTTMVPLDKLFGTYEDGSKWAKHMDKKKEQEKQKETDKAAAASAAAATTN
jgi:sterol desaturase/sphingolipid hydroxylase (fatty acid hydroxylase superfamily)